MSLPPTKAHALLLQVCCPLHELLASSPARCPTKNTLRTGESAGLKDGHDQAAPIMLQTCDWRGPGSAPILYCVGWCFAEQPVLLITAPNHQQCSPDPSRGAGQPPIHLLPAGLFLLPLKGKLRDGGPCLCPWSKLTAVCLPLQDGFLNPTCNQARSEGVRC